MTQRISYHCMSTTTTEISLLTQILLNSRDKITFLIHTFSQRIPDWIPFIHYTHSLFYSLLFAVFHFLACHVLFCWIFKALHFVSLRYFCLIKHRSCNLLLDSSVWRIPLLTFMMIITMMMIVMQSKTTHLSSVFLTERIQEMKTRHPSFRFRRC